ncbi:MAG TPA: alkaline phosphatase family protein [Candidatus Nitrosotalea sp.]|nr:alkaline phosphatase family protein [Candidatus Nitrosotalea sp.]
MPATYSATQNGIAQSPNGVLAQPNLPTPIQHVIIVFQENRTPDYLFQGIAGADIATYGYDHNGNKVPLAPISLTAPYDLGHSHDAWVQDYNGGKMNYFEHGQAQANRLRAFGYGPPSEVQPYHDMANQYVLGDRMFQTNQGPSYPAHLYIVSGTATDPTIRPYLVRDNPYDQNSNQAKAGGCDSPLSNVVHTINPKNNADGPTPWTCFDRPVLSDYLDKKNLSWRYYQQGGGVGLWHAYDSIKHVRYGSDYANVITSSAQFLTDIKAGKLAAMTWLNPNDPWSDHSRKGGAGSQGPAWVAAVVNAVGESKYWNNTTILVTWDDWGGWYDHVPPPNPSYYELGFRVPLLVISPYARKSYVSKVQHEFGSLLAYSEETFGIPKGILSTTDVRADDLKDCFDFTQQPRKFVHIKAPVFKGAIMGGITNAEDP